MISECADPINKHPPWPSEDGGLQCSKAYTHRYDAVDHTVIYISDCNLHFYWLQTVRYYMYGSQHQICVTGLKGCFSFQGSSIQSKCALGGLYFVWRKKNKTCSFWEFPKWSYQATIWDGRLTSLCCVTGSGLKTSTSISSPEGYFGNRCSVTFLLKNVSAGGGHLTQRLRPHLGHPYPMLECLV